MKKQMLLYAIGNPGRADDGLGLAFLENIPDSPLLEKRHAYQLNIEDSEIFSKFSEALVIDAGINLESNFQVKEVVPVSESSFSTHSLSIESVLAITDHLYRAQPKVQILAIRGIDFQLKTALSSDAKSNLSMAVSWFYHTFHDLIAE